LTELNSILGNSVGKYQYLINNIADVIIEIDLNGTFTYISPQVRKIFGYKPEELIGAKFFNYIHPDDMPSIINTFEKALRSEESVSIEYRIKHKEGHYVNVIANGSLVKVDNNVKLVGVLKDITQKKLAEQKLKESEESFKKIINQSFMGIVIVQDLSIKYANEAVRKMLGYSSDEMVKWSMNDFLQAIHPNDRAIAKERLEQRQEGLLTESRYMYQVLTKTGDLRWIEIYGKQIYYQGKESILATLIDVSDSERAVLKVKESEEKYRMIFNGANDPIAILDEEKIIDCNDITAELFGYKNKDEIIGNPPWKISPKKQPDGKDSIKKANEFIKKALLGEPQRFYWKHMKKDGTLFDAEISLSSFKLDNKEYIMAIIRDITERKKAERELREINQLKTELLERTSHELKTPLISIKGFTNLLLDLHKDKFDDETASILEEVREGTEQLEAIINKLLVSSHLASGKLDFNPTLDDLSFLIKFCVKNLRGLANTRKHFITLDIQERLMVNFEKEKLYEVISHLLINAIKYTPPNGEIKIHSEIKDAFIIISVEDNGVGMSAEDQKKIFKQFGKIERYGQGWDIGIEGTGMGLYTSKKIVELHGGKIWVESEGRNKGSKFSFSLPCKKD
jgi:PAS domain S-box-containing protein